MPQKVAVPVAVLTATSVIWNNPIHPHNPMMDHRGRVWMTAAVRPASNPDYCKRGVGQSVREVLPARAQLAAGRRLRSADRKEHAGRHLLQHAPPAVRRGQGPHAVFLGRRERDRLDQHARLGRDRRRGAVAGLVPDGRRHDRRRQDRRVHAAEPAAGSRQGHARRRLRLRHHRQSRTTDRSGGPRRACRAGSAGWSSASNPPLTCQRRGLRTAVQSRSAERHRRARAARHRHRSQRRHLDRRSRADRTWRRSIAASARR